MGRRLMCITGAALLAAATAHAENRSIDGVGNNVSNASWGSTRTAFLRLVPHAYPDDGTTMAGGDRPNPRAVSNAVVAQNGLYMPNDQGLSAFVWQWGQFLDHDLDLAAGGDEPANVPVPMGDPYFDPFDTGTQVIPFTRSAHNGGNPRQQINAITAYIDASNVYGSDILRAEALRAGVGGLLKVTPHESGDLLPLNTTLLPNANEGPLPADMMFLAGDERANEQVGLTAMHTLFVREHNRIAAALAADGMTDDEEIYQRARKIVGAQMQVITYNEFLPALLGPDALPAYTGYRADVDASIANEFATAAYRIGHTMIGPALLRMDNHGHEMPDGHMALRDAFFNPLRITEEGGIEPILRGLVMEPQQQIDGKVVDELRNFLFGPPGAGGLDLATLNIQRGRDHGLPDYNTIRQGMGLDPITDFHQITSDTAMAEAMQGVYGGNVNLIDAWVGLIAEDHYPGAAVGETLRAILALQFTRLRDGDRFWYQNDDAFSAEDLAVLESTTLSDIILRNTSIAYMPANAFYSSDIPEPATMALLSAAAAGAWRRRRR